MSIIRSVVLISTFTAIGCTNSDVEKNAPIQTAKAPAVESTTGGESSNQTIKEPTERRIGGVKFEIPAGWEEKALASTVLLGEFGLPGDTGPGRLTLSTAGGGTTANLERWKGQFQRGTDDPEPKETPLTIAGKASRLIEVSGTFTDTFGGGGPKSHWQLLGVAIPIDAEHNYFIKLTGPQSTIAARRDEFLKFVESARFE